jgi:hypothetical protein
MMDRTSRGGTPGQLAELKGIVPQLTTPSRNHGELVDLWFGVEWNEPSDDWEKAFSTVVAGRRPDPLTPSFFALFAHASTNGLIVARHVRRDAAAWRQAEDEARSLVADVNAEVRVDPVRPSTPAIAQGRWMLRVREASTYFASLRWLGEPKRHFPVAELPIQVSGPTSHRAR